jgi:hypothetical protein
MFAATLATSGATFLAASPLRATRARRSPGASSPVKLASPLKTTTVRRLVRDRRPREVRARAQVTTEEVTVTEVSGSVAAQMPDDESFKVRDTGPTASSRVPFSKDQPRDRGTPTTQSKHSIDTT